MKKAFTMAEVLITLGIIGIVAAMTLPSLIAKHQKKVLVTKLKKTYTTLSQALIQSQLVNGPFDTWPSGKNIADAEDYFNLYYKPYFNGVQICKMAVDCGYETDQPWKNIKGNTITWGLQSKSSRIFFILNDGTAVFIPRNTTDEQGKPTYVSVIYVDVNGYLSPNVLGKDVFQFRMDNKNTLRPYCYNQTSEYINSNCTKDSSGLDNCCTDKIMADGWDIKDDYPW